MTAPDLSKFREQLAEVVSAHCADSSDEQRVNGEWTWGLNCDCGEFVPDAEVNTHLADAMLASPVLAQIRAEAKGEALREAKIVRMSPVQYAEEIAAAEERGAARERAWALSEVERIVGQKLADRAEASGQGGEL